MYTLHREPHDTIICTSYMRKRYTRLSRIFRFFFRQFQCTAKTGYLCRYRVSKVVYSVGVSGIGKRGDILKYLYLAGDSSGSEKLVVLGAELAG